MKRSVLSAIASFALLVGAMASNATAQEPPKWQGLYGGFYTGYAALGNDYTDSVLGSLDLDIDGWINGLTVGMNWRHGQFLFGIEVDGAIVDAGDDVACAGGRCRVDWNSYGSARGRIGWIFGDEDDYAVYVTGGFAAADFDARSTLVGGNGYTEAGWVIGGGIEAYVFNTNFISNKIEYTYSDFGNGHSFPIGSADTADIESDAHILKIGMNIHF
ncbi:MAG: outer membrane protein [Hyphomicrobiales bacterium]